MCDKTYNILIVHPNRAFDAKINEHDATVFVDFFSTNEDDWYLVTCYTEEGRESLLELLKNDMTKKQQYTLGYAAGRRSVSEEK